MINQSIEKPTIERLKMKSLISCSLLIGAALIWCGPGFTQTKDCEDAVAACKQECGELKVYDYETQGFTTKTIFKDACEYTCKNTLKPCQEQSSTLGCDTFMQHCVSNCPWKVRNQGTSEMNPSTDAFYQCGFACLAGDKACKATRRKLQQNRPRTGTFNICTEAQGACYTACMGLVPVDSRGIKVPSDFPDLCAEACAAGVDPCNNGYNDLCSDYYGNCADACPDTNYDEEVDEFYSDTDQGKGCLQSCSVGANFCQKLKKEGVEILK